MLDHMQPFARMTAEVQPPKLLLLLLLRCPAYLCGSLQAAAESRGSAQQSRGCATAEEESKADERYRCW